MPGYVLDHHLEGLTWLRCARSFTMSQNAEKALVNLVASATPGGAILLIEPDFLPVSVAEPQEVRAFWEGWLLGLENVEATAETALYQGGSPWAVYWEQTVRELRPRLVASGRLENSSIDTFLEHCADPTWWTQTIAFTAVTARTPAG